MEGELIFLGFIMLIGQIILLQMWNNNWFKKENFKIKKTKDLADNKLRMRKLERDLGLTPSKAPKEEPSTMGTLSNLTGLLPLLKNLDADQLSGLVDKFIGGGAETEEQGDVVSMLMEYATRNPEMVQGLIEGLTKGKTEESNIYNK